MRRIVYIILVVFLLSGCSFLGGNIPEGFSRESYKDMVDAYRNYEQQKIDHEPHDDILEVMFEYRKLADDGKLTEAEMAVRDLISRLSLAYIGAYTGLSDEVYDITTMVPDTITVEMGQGLKIEDIKEAEERVMDYLELEPLALSEEAEKLKREALKEASRRLMSFISVGESATPYGYDDSYVVYREDRDEYYVASALVYKARSYKYDMILDGDLNFVDAYMVDDIAGILSTPMNDDRRPLWAEDYAKGETGKAEVDGSVASTTENSEQEQNDPMEGSFGSEGEVSGDEFGTTPDEQEGEQPDPELPEWDKAQFLGATLSDLSSTLSEMRKINDAAMSLAMDVENANETVTILSELRNQLELMTLDPTTSVHFTEAEKELTQQILASLESVIEAALQMISDPSTQNIRIAESTTEESQVYVGSAQFKY